MTSHSYHEDSHTNGLADGCPRCQEQAEHPRMSLDAQNLARIASGQLLTDLDRKAWHSYLEGR